MFKNEDEVILKLLKDTGLKLDIIDGMPRFVKIKNTRSNIGMTAELALARRMATILGVIP